MDWDCLERLQADAEALCGERFDDDVRSETAARLVREVERPKAPASSPKQPKQRVFGERACSDTVEAKLGPEGGVGEELRPAARYERAADALDEREEGEDAKV
jgi:hypothetical protein